MFVRSLLNYKLDGWLPFCWSFTYPFYCFTTDRSPYSCSTFSTSILHSNYVGVIDDSAQERNGVIPSNTIDIVAPRQYRTDDSNKSAFIEIDCTYEAAKHSRFVAATIFRSLDGSK